MTTPLFKKFALVPYKIWVRNSELLSGQKHYNRHEIEPDPTQIGVAKEPTEEPGCGGHAYVTAVEEARDQSVARGEKEPVRPPSPDPPHRIDTARPVPGVLDTRKDTQDPAPPPKKLKTVERVEIEQEESGNNLKRDSGKGSKTKGGNSSPELGKSPEPSEDSRTKVDIQTDHLRTSTAKDSSVNGSEKVSKIVQSTGDNLKKKTDIEPGKNNTGDSSEISTGKAEDPDTEDPIKVVGERRSGRKRASPKTYEDSQWITRLK